MTDVIVVCDRCGKTVHGIHIEPSERDPIGGTSGYYNTAPLSPWANFANPGENILCDDCMFADPRYIAVYGDHRQDGWTDDEEEDLIHAGLCPECGGELDVCGHGADWFDEED